MGTYATTDAAPTMTMYAAPAATTYATPTTTAFTAPSYSPAAVMMPGTATMAPMNSQFVGLPSAQSMVAYPSYPGMLPQSYMPSISGGMVAPTIVNMGATTSAATDVLGHTTTG